MSRGWAKASACRLQVSLSCAFLCHIVSLQYLSRSSLHRLAGLPCRLFLSYGLQVATREVHRSSFRRLMCPAQDYFVFLTSLFTENVMREVEDDMRRNWNKEKWTWYTLGLERIHQVTNTIRIAIQGGEYDTYREYTFSQRLN